MQEIKVWDGIANVIREQIEEVFSLGGGELEGEPWEATIPSGLVKLNFPFWYQGGPAHSDRFSRNDSDLRTVILDCMFGLPPKTLICSGPFEGTEDAETWERVHSFSSSGSAACPVGIPSDAPEGASLSEEDLGSEAKEVRPCPFCESAEDEEHGEVYIGAAWKEVVYQRMAQSVEG